MMSLRDKLAHIDTQAALQLDQKGRYDRAGMLSGAVETALVPCLNRRFAQHLQDAVHLHRRSAASDTALELEEHHFAKPLLQLHASCPSIREKMR